MSDAISFGELYSYPAQADWAKIVVRPHLDTKQLTHTVSTVLDDIKARGDEAVRHYELQFDHAQRDSFRV